MPLRRISELSEKFEPDFTERWVRGVTFCGGFDHHCGVFQSGVQNQAGPSYTGGVWRCGIIEGKDGGWEGVREGGSE